MAVNLQHGIGKTKTTDTIDCVVLITFIILFFECKLSCKKSVKERNGDKEKNHTNSIFQPKIVTLRNGKSITFSQL